MPVLAPKSRTTLPTVTLLTSPSEQLHLPVHPFRSRNFVSRKVDIDNPICWLLHSSQPATIFSIMSISLPVSKADWKARASAMNVAITGCLTPSEAQLPSGSQFTESDFLSLRILHCPSIPVRKLHRDNKDIFSDELTRPTIERFNNNQQVEKLKPILDVSRKKAWTPQEIIATAQFAVAMEFLRLIVERKSNDSDPKESERVIKIHTPRKNRYPGGYTEEEMRGHFSQLKVNPQSQVSPQTPTRENFVLESSILGDTPNTTFSVADSEKDEEMQRIRAKYEQEFFEMGDEQTVNACLVSLIMNVGWILDRHGIVHLDRRAFRVQDAAESRGTGSEHYLYEARVDGIITGNDDIIHGFLEVKRDLRGLNKSVRMQESAQMAAVIHNDPSPPPLKRNIR